MGPGIDPATIIDQVQRFISHGTTALDEARAAEYTATAGDDLVTATLADGETVITLHTLAKRRLDREDLAAAVVEAVQAAEQAAQDAARAAVDDAINGFAYRDMIGDLDTLERHHTR